MDGQARAFLKQQLESGASKDAARRELISQGYGSTGFTEAYAELISELGTEPTAAPAPEAASSVTFSPSNIPATAALPGVWAMFTAALNATRQSVLAIIVATMLIVGVLIVFSFIPTAPTPFMSGPVFIVVTALRLLFTVIFVFVAVMALVYSVIWANDGQTYFGGLFWAYGNLFSISWLLLLVTCVLFMGFTVLILPGLVLSVYLIFTFMVNVSDGMKGSMAMVRSTDLVYNYFWPILGRTILLILMAAIVCVPGVVLAQLLRTVMPPTIVTDALSLVVTVIFAMIACTIFVAGVGYLYQLRAVAKPFFELQQYKLYRLILRAMAVLGFAFPLVLIYVGGVSSVNFFNQYIDIVPQATYRPPAQEDDGERFDDFIVETRLDEAFASANFYYSRIRSFDGICQDVSLEEPVECKNSSAEFVLFAPLSNDQFYCRDANRFKGYITAPPVGEACQ